MSQQLQFHYGIVSYDFHSYFNLDDPDQAVFAERFKGAFQEEFKDEIAAGHTRLFRTFLEAIGPHPDGYGMFESDTKSPDAFLKILNFYQLNHGPLSVLIHPRSGRGALSDHTKHAFWLGDKLPLKIGILNDDEK
jgi:DOPA 4,5-dioxygenase